MLKSTVDCRIVSYAKGMFATTAVLCLTIGTNSWSAESRPAASAKGSGTLAASTAGVKSSTIFWGVDKSGVLMLSDRPATNTSQNGSATFTSPAESAARAQRERDYWRDQADRFSARQRERDRAIDEARRLRVIESREREGGFFLPPVYYRSADWWAQRGQPLVSGFSVPSTYQSSPGVASNAPASFIGSGFSSTGRR